MEVESLNPMFQDKHSSKIISTKEESESPLKRKRQTRADKCHNIKFPVTPIMQMKLRTYCKQMGGLYHTPDGQALSQTVFNTSLLQFGLHHAEIVDWTLNMKILKRICTRCFRKKNTKESAGLMV